MEFLNLIPIGYRFCPTDYELIEYYLKKIINGEKLPINDFREIISFNNYHPQTLCTAENRHKRGNNWYFYTRRERKYKNSGKPNRKVKDSNGYWKASGVDAPINRNGQVIGYKMTLDFYDNKSTKSQWKMHEYRIHKDDKSEKWDKYVLCEIYINTTIKKENDDEASNSRNNGNIIHQDDLCTENINIYPREVLEHEQKFVGMNNIMQFDNDDNGASIPHNNDNIIHQDDLSTENINTYPREGFEHEQNFEGINNIMQFGDDDQEVLMMIRQDNPTPENMMMKEKIEHEQNFAGIDYDNFEFGDYQNNNTTTTTTEDSVNDDRENVYVFKGFDELSEVIKRR